MVSVVLYSVLDVFGVFLDRKDDERWTAVWVSGDNEERNTLRPRFLLSLSDTHSIHTLWSSSIGCSGRFGMSDVDSSSLLSLLHLHSSDTSTTLHYIILPIPSSHLDHPPQINEREFYRVQYTIYNKRKGADHISLPLILLTLNYL